MWLVTIKQKKNKRHDPANKVTRACPASPLLYELTGDTTNFACSDATGEHHTFPLREHPARSADPLLDTEQVKDFIQTRVPGTHITRVEGPY